MIYERCHYTPVDVDDETDDEEDSDDADADTNEHRVTSCASVLKLAFHDVDKDMDTD